MDPQALGRFLRQTREAKELTLDEAERALRIRRRILEGFEVGEFTLPEFAPIQIRGFVRNYARFLGLDEDRVLSLYEEALVEGAKALSGRRRRQQRDSRRKNGKRDTGSASLTAARSVTDTQPILPVAPSITTSSTTTGLRDRPRGGLGAALLRVLVALAAIAVIVFVVAELLRSGELDIAPDVNSDTDAAIVGLPPAQPTFTPLPTEVSVTPTVALPLQPGFTGQGVLVTVEMTQRTYLRLVADGVSQFAGLARIGDVLEVPANSTVEIAASNAEALRVVYNGQRQPVFGDRGQAVFLTFSPAGVDVLTGPGFDPTPEVPPTALPTPTADAGTLVGLLTPTNTPGPSPTPSDTPTITNTPTITPTPSDTPVPTDTPTITLTPSDTPLPSNTPTITPVPTDTPIPTNTLTPSPTVILPPRQPAPGATPTKVK
ncbi:MAG: DUF4115 domain-containing protein [Chloroflexi bacterium]|nr:DUF4115 domain-containing protein [Chloroflexota bacterium]